MADKMNIVRIVSQDLGKKSNMEYQQSDIPAYGDNEILIKIMGASICGSDLHMYLAEFEMPFLPIAMGHEFSGEVVAVGKDVSRVKPGDRVVTELMINACGCCDICNSGAMHMCPHKTAPGIHIDGAYAQYITMNATYAHILPENVSWVAGSMIEPAAVVYTGLLERCEVKPEDFVVVFGAGPLGLIAIQMAKAVGARKVVMVEGYNKIRADKARELGADLVIDDPNADVAKIIMDMTNGTGADVACDCSGAEGAYAWAIKCVRRAGRISCIGMSGAPVKLDMYTCISKAINLITTYSSTPKAWTNCISMINRGALNLDALCTHVFPLEQYEDAFKVLLDKTAIKVVLAPNGPIR